MVYVSGGQVHDSRPWSAGSVSEMFWSFINFIMLFFRTLVQPSLTGKGTGYTSSYSNGNSRGGGGPPKPPRRRMGGFGRGCGPSPPPMAGGG